jgi:hypothetical protein
MTTCVYIFVSRLSPCTSQIFLHDLAACINQQLEEGGYFLGNQQTLKLLLRGV